MIRTCKTSGVLFLSLALCLATTHIQADVLIADFQGNTFAPWNVQGGTEGVSGAVVADTEPDFAGDLTGFVADAGDANGFQTVLQMNGLPWLLDLHANDTIEWEVDSAAYSGGFLNNHVVFQSNDPIAFNVLDGSSQFMNATEDDQFYSHNYGSGEGRTILDTIDPDHNGVIDAPYTFFNIFVIQQIAPDTTSAVRYDDFRLTVIPEPATTSLLVLGSFLASTLPCFGRRWRG